MTAYRYIQNLELIPAEFVSLLGSATHIDTGTPAPINTISITVASLTILDDESIFVGMTQTVGDGLGWTATDNLSNTYVLQAGPYLQTTPVIFGTLAGGMLACLNPTPGVLTSIAVSWTNMTGLNNAVAVRAVRFKNIGAPISSTVEVKQDAHYTADNYIFTDLSGPPGSVGIGVWSSRTAGITGDPYTPIGVNLGANNTTGGADSGNAVVMMGYTAPLTTSGLGHAFAGQDTTRAIIHCGKAYNGA